MNFAIKYLPFKLQPYLEVTLDLSKKLQTESSHTLFVQLLLLLTFALNRKLKINIGTTQYDLLYYELDLVSSSFSTKTHFLFQNLILDPTLHSVVMSPCFQVFHSPDTFVE